MGRLGGAFGEEYASQQAAVGMQTLLSTPRTCDSIQIICKKRHPSPRSPRILFTLHCLSVWIATQSNTLQMFSVSLTRLSQPMPHHMCRLIKQAIFLGADSRPMTINISASSFRISSGFIKYLNPSVLWAQSKQRANQRTTTDID